MIVSLILNGNEKYTEMKRFAQFILYHTISVSLTSAGWQADNKNIKISGLFFPCVY